MGARLDRRLVAVMFTDMVGFTGLMQRDEQRAIDKRDRYAEAVDRHHTAFEGTLVRWMGDGSLSTFPSVLAAARAAIEIQRELAAQDVPVRVGIHVGEVIIEPENLTGDAVNVASRIESFGVPGGVMVSDAAYDLIKNRTDISVVSVGRFKLKHVGRPFELYALVADGIVVPDPAAIEGKGDRFASLPGTLPDPGNALHGRSDDLASLVELAAKHNVVTITGPGGVGKTRIMIELGRVLAPGFMDGVAFVELAEVKDASDFIPAIAASLDVKEAEGRTLRDGVVSLIGDKEALLLLDNLEQVVEAASEVSDLVGACLGLRVVCTSRTPLRIAHEREYPLHPLALPPAEVGSVDALLASPAAALFIDRAEKTHGSFEVTAETAPAISAVCRRLDGLPLALELAAARLRLLSPEALLDRLGHALDVLTSGPRDAPQRQRTMRAAIDWSHSLLTESDQRLFRRLAVFSGSFSFGDVEAICADPGASSLDELESLVDNALVQFVGQGDRLRMLETIAEYARERLQAAGEAQEVTMRHARRYAALAGEIRDGIEGTDQIRSIERGITDEPNIQAALDTLLAAADGGDPVSAEAGMQMCGDLYMYWHIRDKNITAHEYSTRFLKSDTEASPTRGRAGALLTAGLAAWGLGRFEDAEAAWSESYRLAEHIQAPRELCVAAAHLGLGMLGSDPEAALRWARECLERSRSNGFSFLGGLGSIVEGIAYTILGDADRALTTYTSALEGQLQHGDQEGAGHSLAGLALLASGRGDVAGALELYERALVAFDTVGTRAKQAWILDEIAWTHLKNDDPSAARRYFLDAVQAYSEVASVRGVGLSVIGLAATEAAEDRPGKAVQLAAAAEVYAHQEGIVNVYSDETPGREFVDRARAALPADEVERAAQLGCTLTIQEALDLARATDGARS